MYLELSEECAGMMGLDRDSDTPIPLERLSQPSMSSTRTPLPMPTGALVDGFASVQIICQSVRPAFGPPLMMAGAEAAQVGLEARHGNIPAQANLI